MVGRVGAYVVSMSLVVVSLVVLVQPTGALDTFNGPGSDGALVAVGAGEQFNFTVHSDSPFDVVIMTEDNGQNFIHNLTYGYIEEYSVFNVTNADIRVTYLPEGYYDVFIVSHGPSKVYWSDFSYKFPSNSIVIPWEYLGVIAVTATVASLGTYGLMKRKQAGK